MAEILIRITDQGPDLNAFRDGDPIVVKDDGWVWGRCEDLRVWVAEGNLAADWPGNSFILKLTNTTASQVFDFVQAHANGIKQRANNLDLSGLNISKGDVLTVTRAQARARLRAAL